MSERKFKPAIPANIQALIRQNDIHAQAIHQAKVNLATANETRFREQHNSFIRNAEVRRNARLSEEESHLQRDDLIVDRRAKLAEIYAADKERWQTELLRRGYTISYEDNKQKFM